MITFDDFKRLEIKIATIKDAEPVEGADRLLRLQISLGEEQRQLVAGIAQHYTPEDLKDKQIVVLANLEPKTLKGVESQGMLLAAVDDGKPVLLQPEQPVTEGTVIG